MPKDIVTDTAVSLLTHFLVLILVIAGIAVMTAPPAEQQLPLMLLLGSQTALNVYGVWLFVIAAIMLLSHYIHSFYWSKFSFFAAYLTSIYIFILELWHVGISYRVLDTLILSVMCAVVWIKISMKYQYEAKGKHEADK